MAIIEGKCAGCGRPIVWGQLPDGTKIPMDPKPATYLLLAPALEHYKVQRANGNKDKAQGQVMVSHFATCPKADQFSRNNRP